MNKRTERFNEIIRLTMKTKHASVLELSQLLGVSEMTVRRDLAALAQQNVVSLIPGGAIVNPEIASLYVESRYELPNESFKHLEEKTRIAEKALSLISANDVITIDAGTTTEILARLIPREFPCTVLCNSFNVLYEIQQKPRCRLIMTGGHFYPETATFESSQGVELIKESRSNLAFMSARGIHFELGVTTAYRHEVESKKAILASSQKKILLVDSTKFNRVEAVLFAEVSDFDTIITNADLSERYQNQLKDLGIELFLV
jgi:DeoR family deoxyribose operon repressor